MTVIHRITEAGDYSHITGVSGDNRDQDIGILVDVWGDDPVVLPALEFENVFIGVSKKGDAPLIIDGDLIGHDFGGDAINWCGGEFHVNGQFHIVENTPTRPYSPVPLSEGEDIAEALATAGYEVYDTDLLIPIEYPRGSGQFVVPGYHADAMQIYALSQGQYVSTADDSIGGLYLPNVHIDISGEASQGFAFTEACKYYDMKIGTESLYSRLDYHYGLIAVNMEGLVYGNETNCDVNKPVRLQNPPAKNCPHGFTECEIYTPGLHALDVGCLESGAVALLDEGNATDTPQDEDDAVLLLADDDFLEVAREFMES